jgi:hypothetical protein
LPAFTLPSVPAPTQSYPESGRKYKVSTAGGSYAGWSKDGREILFLALDFSSIMIAEVQPGPVFKAERPRTLFEFRPSWSGFAAARDFSKFLVAVPEGEATPASITLELNWAEGLKK